MGAAARTMLALYCANAAVGRLAATPARAGPTPLAARALTVEGGAREATNDAVETENRERLCAAGVMSQNTLLRRHPAPPAARALHTSTGSKVTPRDERDGRDDAAASESLKTQVRSLQQPPQPRERLPQALRGARGRRGRRPVRREERLGRSFDGLPV